MAKGKGIENWTDVDYAQAAIDMLPGTVEEMWVFLEAQGIKNIRSNTGRSSSCPIAQWVRKWTGSAYVGVGWDNAYVGVNSPTSLAVPLPKPIDDFVVAADLAIRRP